MTQREQDDYIAQLTPMELRVLKIAKIQLESSFSLVKSIGFINWQKTQKALALLVPTIEVLVEVPITRKGLKMKPALAKL
jgi:hypothetical protein